MKEFKLPDLGEGIHEAQVVKVMIQEGDAVTADQMVMEVETDKAAVELPVPFTGTVTKLNVKPGDTVSVGQVLLVVSERAEVGTPTETAATTAAARAAGLRQDVAIETEEDAGAAVAVKQAAPEIEEPIYGPGPVPAAPAVRRLARELGVDLHRVRGSGPGERILRDDVERYREGVPTKAAAPAAAVGPPPTTPVRTPPPPVGRGPAPASMMQAPAVPIDPIAAEPLVATVTAPLVTTAAAPPVSTAPAGAAVTTAPPPLPAASPFVQAAPAGRPEAGPGGVIGPGGAPAGLAEPLPDFAQWGPVHREQVPQIRKTIARQMARAWAIIPHVTHADEADVTDLEAFRREQGKIFEERGAKLTLTAFIMKAVAGALRNFPKFNASFDEAASEIIYKDYVHIGVAVDTPRGLMVPVIRDVDRKGLTTLSKELKEIADRARAFKLDIAEMRGGTFTVTNVGALGGTLSTPMINWPEVAILGIGKLMEKPVVRDGQIVARKMLPLFISFDHRVIDGADGARFVQAIVTFLENPLNLLLVS